MVLAEALASKPELAGQAFSFSNESQVTVLEVVDRLLHLMNSNLKPEIRNEVTNEIRSLHLNASRAREVSSGSPSSRSMKVCAKRSLRSPTKTHT